MADINNGRTLAIIDDEPWARIGMRDIIDWSEYGFDGLLEFDSAEAAYERLREIPVHAVITDIRLGGMSGLELAEKLLTEKLATAVVIVSAYRDFECARKAIETGVLHYLLKPLVPEEVMKVAAKLQSIPDSVVQDKKIQRIRNCYVAVGSEWEHTELPVIRVRPARDGKNGWLIETSRPLRGEEAFVGLSCRRDSFDEQAEMLREAYASGQFGIVFCTHPAISRIQLFIMDNYEKKLKNAEIANMVFMSEAYMCECFKKHTGETIVAFITKVRIQRALELLDSTDLSITEISERVGYSDAGYFGRVFRKLNGESPEQYRKRME